MNEEVDNLVNFISSSSESESSSEDEESYDMDEELDIAVTPNKVKVFNLVREAFIKVHGGLFITEDKTRAVAMQHLHTARLLSVRDQEV